MRSSFVVGTIEDDFYRALGFAIRRQRRLLDLTQEELGRRLEPRMTRASIANIESGKQRLLVHRLVDIADALEVKISRLIGAARPKSHDAPGLEKELTRDLESKVSAKVASELARKVAEEMTHKQREVKK
jgi:transcriptional regulator with XRE-family HTH domain